jgi:ribosomal protein S18 acetylase RimI-like enzyme
MSDIQIASYQAGDETAMAAIAPRAFGVWARYGIDYSLPRDRVEEEYREEALGYAEQVRAADPNLAVFVARLDGAIVGYIALGIDLHRTRRFDMKWGQLISLAVDPDYHHRGVGKALVARAMAWFREERCEYVEVQTDQNNIAAIRTYEGAGFRTIYCGLTLSQPLD